MKGLHSKKYNMRAEEFFITKGYSNYYFYINFVIDFFF